MFKNKYRGNRIDNGEIVSGYLIGDDVIVGKIVEFNDEYFNTEFWYKVDPQTVGQFTGVIDPNGKEVYENDELKVTCNFELRKGIEIDTVRYVDGYFYCNDWTLYDILNSYMAGEMDFEVIS